MFLWPVTPCSLVDANISEESAASIFSATLKSVAVHYSVALIPSHRTTWRFITEDHKLDTGHREHLTCHVQALKIHLIQWTSYMKHEDLTLTSYTCWNCRWGTCMGVSFEKRVQPYCRAPPRPFPHTTNSSVKFLLQISNILNGWDVCHYKRRFLCF